VFRIAGPSTKGGGDVAQDVLVRLDENGSSAERMAELTSRLQEELRQLGLRVTRPTNAQAPPGSRGGAVASIAELLVTSAGTAAALNSVGTVLSAWLQRGGGRKVEVTIGEKSIILDAATKAQQERLLKTFLQSLDAE
jgi:hypothetical protein